MAKLNDRLFEYIERGWVVVMPTEEASRSLLTHYVLEKKKGIVKERVIAFDTFLSLLFPERKGKNAADDLTRLLFSKDLVERASERLSYFIPTDSYPEMTERIVPFISSMLPHLDEAEDTDELLAENVKFIRKEYSSFLEKAGLYEMNDMQGFINTLDNTYVIALPDRDAETREIISRFPDMKNIILLEEGAKAELPELTVYSNEKQEIRDTFTRISALLEIKEDGKAESSIEKIAISTPSLDRTKPYLVREAELFDIPLTFMQGRPALEYPAGRFLTLLQDLYESDYELETVKAFFLNPSFPFRNREAARAFVLNAIRCNVKKREKAKDRYFRAENRDVPVYKTLIHYNDQINTTSDPVYLIRELKSLFQELLSDEQFGSNAEDADVFSFIMSRAMSFSSTVQALRDKGLIGEIKLFPLFISWMKDILYVPQDVKEGVRVYPLPQAAGVEYEHHFILSLNENDARKVRKDASFLSDYEIKGRRSERDTTRSMLGLFALGNEYPHFSASERTYTGSVLPLTDFTKKKDAVLLDDSWRKERDAIRGGDISLPLYPLQKKGREFAERNELLGPDYDEDMSLGLHIPDDDFSSVKHEFSYSQIDSYIRCPFYYLSSYVFGLKNERKYEVVDWPAMEIGNRLHKVAELFLSGPREEMTEDKIETLLDAELEQWSNGLTTGRDDKEHKLAPDVPLMTPELAVHIKAEYLPGLTTVLMNIREKLGTAECEKLVKGELDGIAFKGYVDLVLTTAEGKTIIDFKTKNGDEKSLQFDIYDQLLGGNSAHSEYHLFKTGTVEKHEFIGRDETVEKVKAAASGVQNGVWKGANTEEACLKCPYRDICRRRFYIE